MLPYLHRPSAKIRLALVGLIAVLLSGCGSAADRAQSYYQHGMTLLAAHENQKAAIEFRNAIKLQKDMLPAWRGLAQVEELNHHLAGLVPALRTIVELDPKDVETKLKLARILLLAGATDQALKLVNSLDEAENANVLALKAAISFKLKDNTSAVREAQDALKIDPGNVDALIVLAANRLATGDAKGALQVIDSSPVAHEKDLGVQLLRLRIFERLGDHSQIESLLRKLIELYPKEVAFRKQLIKFYIDQHRPDDAEKEARATAAAYPGNPEAQLDLIRFLYAVKGPAAARQELLDRINAGGEVFAYQMALADLDFTQGNVADSFKLLANLAGNTNAPEHALAAKIRLAELNLNKKNIDTAEALVAEILKSDSRNVTALKLRASIRMDRGQLEPAISDLRQALNDQPRSIELMLLLATAYERSGSIELAEKQFADATRASNYQPTVGLNYVAFLQRRGSIQRAEDVLTDLANRNPKNIGVLSALAEIKLRRQDWIGAQEISDTIRRISDNKAIADQILGVALSGQHKDDASIVALQNAVADEPAAVQPMVLLVRALLRAKQTDRAVSFLQSVLATNPGNAEAHVLLGAIQLANNTPDQAIKSFTAAIEKQPKDVVGYRALAELYLTQKNNAAALQVIRAGLKEQPDSIILHMTLAGIMETNRNYDGAIAEYEYILKQQPGSIIAINNLASMLSSHRTDEASLERAKTLAASLRKSQVPQFKDTLGWVDYRLGDFKAAVPLLEDAAAALPNMALIHYHLGMGYVATGQQAKANAEFKTALAHAPDAELEREIKAAIEKMGTQ